MIKSPLKAQIVDSNGRVWVETVDQGVVGMLWDMLGIEEERCCPLDELESLCERVSELEKAMALLISK